MVALIASGDPVMTLAILELKVHGVEDVNVCNVTISGCHAVVDHREKCHMQSRRKARARSGSPPLRSEARPHLAKSSLLLTKY
jgi:hypothetical protein